MIWIPFFGTLALLFAAILRAGPEPMATMAGLTALPVAPLGMAAGAAVGGFAGLVAVHHRRFTAGRVVGTLIGLVALTLSIALVQAAIMGSETSRGTMLLAWLSERPAFAGLAAHGLALTGGFLILGMDHHGRGAALIGVAVTLIAVIAAMALPFMGLAGGPLPMLPVLVLLTAMVRMGDQDTLEDAFLIPGALTSLAALAAVMLADPGAASLPLPDALSTALIRGALWVIAPFVLASALVIRLKPGHRLSVNAANLLGILLVLACALTLGAGVERAAPGPQPNLIAPPFLWPAALALPVTLLSVVAILALRRQRRGKGGRVRIKTPRKARA